MGRETKEEKEQRKREREAIQSKEVKAGEERYFSSPVLCIG